MAAALFTELIFPCQSSSESIFNFPRLISTSPAHHRRSSSPATTPRNNIAPFLLPLSDLLVLERGFCYGVFVTLKILINICILLKYITYLAVYFIQYNLILLFITLICTKIDSVAIRYSIKSQPTFGWRFNLA